MRPPALFSRTVNARLSASVAGPRPVRAVLYGLVLAGLFVPPLAKSGESDGEDFRRQFRRAFEDLRSPRCGDFIDVGVAIAETPLFAAALSKSARFGFLDALVRCARHFGRHQAEFRAAEAWVAFAPKEVWPQTIRFYYGAGFGRPQASLDAFDALLAKVPRLVRSLDISYVYPLLDAADRVDGSGDRKLALHELFQKLGLSPAPPHNDDFLRLGHARLLLARGRVDEARVLLSTVTETQAIARIRIDRLFDPLREDPAFESRLNLEIAAERDLARARKAMEENPRLMAAINRYLAKLAIIDRLQEALELCDEVLAQYDSNPKSYTDGENARRWLLDTRAHLLSSLGRHAEATDSLLQAANMLEWHRPNVSNMINLAGHLVDLGRTADALRMLQQVSEATVYGQAWIQALRVCAATQMDDPDTARNALEYLKTHEADNVAALSKALLCVNDLESAAALMIRRLQQQRTSDEALLTLQEMPEDDSNAPPYRRLIQERFNMVRARADVRAAAETVGRIEVLPVHLRSGY